MPEPRPRGPSVRATPEGDDREHLMCDDCGFVLYENPKIVVGAVVTEGDRVLLCRRAINPRKGYWTLPSGYMELGETTEAGAVRKAWEEARARIEIDTLLAVWNIPRISQVQLIYRARQLNNDIAPGLESEDIALCTWDRIPWDDLAFPTVAWSLEAHRRTRDLPAFTPATGTAGSPPPDDA